MCGASYSKQLEINDWTHQNGVHFVAAETRGLFGWVSSRLCAVCLIIY
jgi:ubiquitin-activating enzyme E1